MNRKTEVYVDASVLVALLTNDPLTSRADDLLRAKTPALIVSDFTAAEVASAIARRVRTGELTPDEARLAFSTFDAWAARATRREHTRAADVFIAETFLRRLDLNLRMPDALNIAIAQRIGAALLSFDEKTSASARALGTPTEAASTDRG